MTNAGQKKGTKANLTNSSQKVTKKFFFSDLVEQLDIGRVILFSKNFVWSKLNFYIILIIKNCKYM